jgi:hypothetical protein
LVARHRHFCRKCVLRMWTQPPALVHHFLVVYATQNPLFVCLLRVELVEGITKDLSCEAYKFDILNLFEYQFSMRVPDFVYSDDNLFRQDFKVEVLPEVIKTEGCLVASDSDFVLLDTLHREFGEGAGELDAEPQPEAPPASAAPAWHEDPWLLNFWEHDLVEVEKVPGKVGKLARDTAAGDSDSDDLEELVDAEAAVHELYEKRLELELRDPQVHEEQFHWTLRGGKWTMQHKGVAYDCVMAKARKGLAEDMRVNYHLARSSSYSLQAYGEDLALKLAICWCHKHSFLLDKWLESGLKTNHTFSRDLEAYQEPPEASSIRESACAQALKRLAAVTRLVPQV